LILRWNFGSDHQWGDVVGVIKVTADALDLACLRRYANELGVTGRLDRALAEGGRSNPDRS